MGCYTKTAVKSLILNHITNTTWMTGRRPGLAADLSLWVLTADPKAAPDELLGDQGHPATVSASLRRLQGASSHGVLIDGGRPNRTDTGPVCGG